MSKAKKPGNPNWKKGGPSPNPGGRPKIAEAFRASCRAFVDEHVLQAWQNEVLTLGKDWLRASELLAAYGYGRPTQTVEVRPETLTDEELRKEAEAVAREALGLEFQ